MKTAKKHVFASLVILTASAVLAVNYLPLFANSSLALTSHIKSHTSGQPASAVNPPAVQPPDIFKPTVQADINQAIATDGDVEVAVSLVDLDTGKQYDAGETGVVFQAASTAKLIAVIDYLHEVELGNVTLDQTIDGTSARQLIKQMLEVSDNTAWVDINNVLGSKQQAYAQSIGLTSFTGGEYNTITAADEAKLLSLLYQGKLINTEHKELMYSYMNAADGTNLIKSALPSDATVYHKYGMLGGNLHDTAIVNYQGHNFALVIFTKNPNDELNDYSQRVALIYSITQAIVADIAA
ncbi:MAG: serine hydrolase [Candidatus Saccharibacteria bacterium]|nr:serine hydrolase [Candidatus Saccharibacteria bacterium]